MDLHLDTEPSNRRGSTNACPGLENELERLRTRLLALLPTVAALCGSDSSQFRLLSRAVVTPERNRLEKLRRLRLAQYAIENAPAEIRVRLQVPSK
jgi:hypothetical protein